MDKQKLKYDAHRTGNDAGPGFFYETNGVICEKMEIITYNKGANHLYKWEIQGYIVQNRVQSGAYSR